MPAPYREPDFQQFLTVLRRGRPERPVLFETYIDWVHIRAILGAEMGPQDDPPWGWIHNQLKAHSRLGHDTAVVGLALLAKFGFPRPQHTKAASRSTNEGGVIVDEASLQAYPWPDPDGVDYRLLDRVAEGLPRGMKITLAGPGGVWENLVDLVGFDRLCFMLADDPELVGKIAREIGSRTLRYFERAVGHPAVGAVIMMDDWGFKTSLMASPASLREHVFPWNARLVQAAHAAGKPAILHSCGHMEMIWGDILEGMAYDAKHSFEDAIEPVEAAYDRLHGRVGILGGFDVDFMSRSTPAEIERRARAMLERTDGGCGYALGTGNSVADYVPLENYCAILRAAGWKLAR